MTLFDRCLANKLVLVAVIALNITILGVNWLEYDGRGVDYRWVFNMNLIGVNEAVFRAVNDTLESYRTQRDRRAIVCERTNRNLCEHAETQYEISSAVFGLLFFSMIGLILSFGFQFTERYPEFISAGLLYASILISLCAILTFVCGTKFTQYCITCDSPLLTRYSSGVYITIAMIFCEMWFATTFQLMAVQLR